MNRVISWLQSVLARAILTRVIVVTAFLINVSLSFGNPLPAHALPLLTIDSSSYAVDPDNDRLPTYTKADGNQKPDLIENSRDKLKSAADNIKEKLNLEQPLNESKKEFLNRDKDKTDPGIKGK
ncbi:MAG TPA: hypothetical protein DDW76_35285 [Cyanobacteria bacterium UBA11369]|nr:hypothetical protein [Cyanobacteria bacterium UBA11369]